MDRVADRRIRRPARKPNPDRAAPKGSPSASLPPARSSKTERKKAPRGCMTTSTVPHAPLIYTSHNARQPHTTTPHPPIASPGAIISSPYPHSLGPALSRSLLSLVRWCPVCAPSPCPPRPRPPPHCAYARSRTKTRGAEVMGEAPASSRSSRRSSMLGPHLPLLLLLPHARALLPPLCLPPPSLLLTPCACRRRRRRPACRPAALRHHPSAEAARASR